MVIPKPGGPFGQTKNFAKLPLLQPKNSPLETEKHTFALVGD